MFSREFEYELLLFCFKFSDLYSNYFCLSVKFAFLCVREQVLFFYQVPGIEFKVSINFSHMESGVVVLNLYINYFLDLLQNNKLFC